MHRRTFLEYLADVTLTSVLGPSQEGRGTCGMIAKITPLSGKRDEVLPILEESAANMQGCSLRGTQHGACFFG
jgi:hypothetical protein